MKNNIFRVLHISKDLVGGIGTVIHILNIFFNNFKNICYDDFNGKNQIMKYKRFHYELKNNLHNVQIIHFHGAWTPHILPLMNNLKQLTVVSPHGALDKVSLEKSKVKKMIVKYLYMKKAYSKANCIHALTEKEAKDIRDYGIKNIPIFVIPNGIDVNEKLEINIVQKNDWLKLANNRKVILSLSRLHSAKGIDMLIDSYLKLYKNSADSTVLFIVGSGDVKYIKHLEQKIISSDLQNNVFLLGELVGVMKNTIYDIANVFILPSFNEGFGITVLEAYRQNVPVITTTATPFGDIQELKCGWYVNPNIADTYNALNEATSLSKEELIQKGKIGNEWIRKNYSIDEIMQKYEKMYAWLVEKSNIPEFIYKG